MQGAVNGTVALVGGNVVFTPAANYNGPASFIHTVSDGNGGASTATVTVNVAAVNDAPVAQAANFTVAEDAAIVNGAVTATDADAGRRSPLRSTARPLLASRSATALTASTPANAAYQSLGVGQQTIITVPYTVTDNAGATSTANLVITVTGTNDAPVANADHGGSQRGQRADHHPGHAAGQRHRHRQRHHADHHQRAGCDQRQRRARGRQRGVHPVANYNGPASFTPTPSPTATAAPPPPPSRSTWLRSTTHRSRQARRSPSPEESANAPLGLSIRDRRRRRSADDHRCHRPAHRLRHRHARRRRAGHERSRRC